MKNKYGQGMTSMYETCALSYLQNMYSHLFPARHYRSRLRRAPSRPEPGSQGPDAAGRRRGLRHQRPGDAPLRGGRPPPGPPRPRPAGPRRPIPHRLATPAPLRPAMHLSLRWREPSSWGGGAGRRRGRFDKKRRAAKKTTRDSTGVVRRERRSASLTGRWSSRGARGGTRDERPANAKARGCGS